MRDTVVGVAWYSRDTWAELRRLVPVPGDLEPTYEDWLAVFAGGFARAQAAGLRPERVEVDLKALLAWCARQVGFPTAPRAPSSSVSSCGCARRSEYFNDVSHTG
jgi:hypothetical protein